MTATGKNIVALTRYGIRGVTGVIALVISPSSNGGVTIGRPERDEFFIPRDLLNDTISVLQMLASGTELDKMRRHVPDPPSD